MVADRRRHRRQRLPRGGLGHAPRGAAAWTTSAASAPTWSSSWTGRRSRSAAGQTLWFHSPHAAPQRPEHLATGAAGAVPDLQRPLRGRPARGLLPREAGRVRPARSADGRHTGVSLIGDFQGRPVLSDAPAPPARRSTRCSTLYRAGARSTTTRCCPRPTTPCRPRRWRARRGRRRAGGRRAAARRRSPARARSEREGRGELPTDDLGHEAVGARYLAGVVRPEVTGPIALHVRAKRYRCAVDPAYLERCPRGRRGAWRCRAARPTPTRSRASSRNPGFARAVRLRTWDDGGKVDGLEVPALEHYRPLLERLAARPERSMADRAPGAEQRAGYGRLVVHLLRWVVLGVDRGGAGRALLGRVPVVARLGDRAVRRAPEPAARVCRSAGLVIGLAYHYGGGRAVEGNNLIIDEIHEPTAWVPRRMAPLVFVGHRRHPPLRRFRRAGGHRDPDERQPHRRRVAGAAPGARRSAHDADRRARRAASAPCSVCRSPARCSASRSSRVGRLRYEALRAVPGRLGGRRPGRAGARGRAPLDTRPGDGRRCRWRPARQGGAGRGRVRTGGAAVHRGRRTASKRLFAALIPWAPAPTVRRRCARRRS